MEIYNGLWLSGLICLLLLQNEWPMLQVVGSNLTNAMALFLTSILSTKKKIIPPLFPIMCFCSCHTMVRSAVLPKTTRLCCSITLCANFIKIDGLYSVYHCKVYAVYTNVKTAKKVRGKVERRMNTEYFTINLISGFFAFRFPDFWPKFSVIF